MGNPAQILVVDDEPQIRLVLRASLSMAGYDVRLADDGDSALQITRHWAPDVVITDLSMPKMDGVELCRRLRERSQVPIIVLSVKQQEDAKIAAFDAGADDYVTKPFNPNELLARIKANLRRASTVKSDTQLIEAGDFRVDLRVHKVWVRENEVHLTPKEFDLLVFFLRRPGTLITHQAVFRAIWGSDTVGQLDYVRVLVAHLRKKIESDPSSPQYLLTEPWIGYRLEPGQ